MRPTEYFKFLVFLPIFYICWLNNVFGNNNPSGTWRGTYKCGQGITGMTLILNLVGSDVSAVFNFYPVNSNPNVPSGSFELLGTIYGNQITLKKHRWISRPQGYNMLDLSLRWDEKRDILTSKICGNSIELKRESNPMSYQPLPVKKETKEERRFKITSLSGTLWFATWKSKSGWDDMGIRLDYNINPSLANGYSVNTKFKRGSLMLNYVYSKAESKFTSDITSNVSPIVRKSLKMLAKRKLSNYLEVELSILQSTFNGNLIIDNAEIFELPEYTILDLNSKWFLGDILFKWHDARYPKLEMGVGYRHTNYKKPLAFTLFYGSKNKDDNIIAEELISGSIEHATISGNYFIICANIIDDIEAISNKKFNLYYGTTFGGGVNNIEGTSSTIKNAFGFVGDFLGGLSYTYPIRESYFRLKLGYRLNFNLSPSCKLMYEENGRSAYYGSYIWENMHGPYCTIEILM